MEKQETLKNELLDIAQGGVTIQEKNIEGVHMLKFEAVQSIEEGRENKVPMFRLKRAKVPGGWLVLCDTPTPEGSYSICFYPDPNHSWSGSSLA